MSDIPDIIVPVEKNPAVVKAGPFITFDVFTAHGTYIAHMDAPNEGTQPHLLSYPESYYPLTVKFKQHEIPVVNEQISHIPAGTEELN